MKTIWKYTLDVSDDISRCVIRKKARILSAGVQGRDIVIWALVDTDESPAYWNFAVRGTGHPIEEHVAARPLVNTVFMGPLVFHVFDLGEVL